MAISIFPNTIPIFLNHKNLLDDVDANDINLIQRELSAVARILGSNPHLYNNVDVAAVETVAVPDDAGGIDPDTVYTTTLKYFNPEVRPVNHGTVSNRLDNIERGKHKHCFRLAASSINIAPSSILFSARPRGIRFPKPNNKNDPFNMHNGVGVVLRKSGFWTFHASVIMNMQAVVAANNNGIFQAAIDVDGTWLEGMDRQKHEAENVNIILKTTRSGFYERGARVTLRVAHDSSPTQKIRNAYLSGFMVREDD